MTRSLWVITSWAMHGDRSNKKIADNMQARIVLLC
jgi:hypothetical protein